MKDSIQTEKFLNSVKQKLDECAKLHEQKEWIFKDIFNQLKWVSTKIKEDTICRIENKVCRKSSDSITPNNCEEHIKYFFSDPGSFDTGTCSDLMMGSINEICFNN